MTRFFYDTEFHEDGETIDLISIGMVAEQGNEYYAINAEADWTRISAHPWLAEHVLPHLPGSWTLVRTAGEPRREWRPDMSDQRVKRKQQIATEVRDFIQWYGYDRASHELWAWYGAYDHVALAQLFGRMIDLPDCIPMHTNDLKTLVGRREVAEVLTGAEHDALVDARWNRDVYRWITDLITRGQAASLASALERAEPRRQLVALDCAWRALDDAAREQIRQIPGATGLAVLLDDAKGVLGS